jgi:uncharacterized protein
MLIGLVGVIIPIFPGILVIWLAALGYGLLSGFDTLGWVMFVFISLAMVAGLTVDNILMGVGARKGGASWWAIIIGFVAGVIGTLIFPPIGGLIAAPAAVMLWEFRRGKNWGRAWLATRGLALGWFISIVARFGIGSLMIGLWFIWALW